MAIKLILSFVFLVLAVVVVASYSHKCMAGHKGFESSTFWISLLGPIAIIWLVKDWRISIPLAFAIPILLLTLNKPYSEWVHGPDSPWPKDRQSER